MPRTAEAAGLARAQGGCAGSVAREVCDPHALTAMKRREVCPYLGAGGRGQGRRERCRGMGAVGGAFESARRYG